MRFDRRRGSDLLDRRRGQWQLGDLVFGQVVRDVQAVGIGAVGSRRRPFTAIAAPSATAAAAAARAVAFSVRRSLVGRNRQAICRACQRLRVEHALGLWRHTTVIGPRFASGRPAAFASRRAGLLRGCIGRGCRFLAPTLIPATALAGVTATAFASFASFAPTLGAAFAATLAPFTPAFPATFPATFPAATTI
ncbi:MAG: hypothetical protein OEV65_06780, partial [Aquincola sp.]|nr:hypothetical protein [Aquincola sp.]